MTLRILTEERLSKSTRRLLIAPDDLVQCGARLAGSGIEQLGTRHAELFQHYVRALRPVVESATDWWLEAVEWQTRQVGDAVRARQVLLEEHPAGPASQGRFVAVVREYWLACDALNAQLEPTDWLDPPKFLLGWTIKAGESLCVEVLASQPYWPICMSKDGDWF